MNREKLKELKDKMPYYLKERIPTIMHAEIWYEELKGRSDTLEQIKCDIWTNLLAITGTLIRMGFESFKLLVNGTESDYKIVLDFAYMQWRNPLKTRPFERVLVDRLYELNEPLFKEIVEVLNEE